MSKRVFLGKLSFENVFRLQVHFRANQTDFDMKGFPRGLVLKQRHKEIRNRLECNLDITKGQGTGVICSL